MAKKKNEPTNQNVTPIKPMDEMSDSEFITYADYLSSPYYRAYMSAKCRNEDAAQTAVAPVRQSETSVEKKSAAKEGKRNKKSKSTHFIRQEKNGRFGGYIYRYASVNRDKRGRLSQY